MDGNELRFKWPAMIGSFPSDHFQLAFPINLCIKGWGAQLDSINKMNFKTLSALAFLSLLPSSCSALTLLGVCARPGFIRLSHRHRFNWHRPAHFRKYVKPAESVDFGTVHDAENVFHLLKQLPNDCFTYVSLIRGVKMFTDTHTFTIYL